MWVDFSAGMEVDMMTPSVLLFYVVFQILASSPKIIQICFPYSSSDYRVKTKTNHRKKATANTHCKLDNTFMHEMSNTMPQRKVESRNLPVLE